MMACPLDGPTALWVRARRRQPYRERLSASARLARILRASARTSRIKGWLGRPGRHRRASRGLRATREDLECRSSRNTDFEQQPTIQTANDRYVGDVVHVAAQGAIRARIREVVSRQGRIATKSGQDRARPGDLTAAHVPVRQLAGGALLTAPGPDPGDLDRCLGAYRTWPSDQVTRRCASR